MTASHARWEQCEATEDDGALLAARSASQSRVGAEKGG